ncbi:MAG: hypothetical protein AAF517_04165 [Planctomycetota bacterium]
MTPVELQRALGVAISVVALVTSALDASGFFRALFGPLVAAAVAAVGVAIGWALGSVLEPERVDRRPGFGVDA